MNTKTIIAILSFLCVAITTNAQEKLQKVSQSIKTNKDVTLDLNTSHTNIIIDTWNKGTVSVEAYVESSELSKEELKKIMDNWTVDVDATLDHVSITTRNNSVYHGEWDYEYIDDEALEALEELTFDMIPLKEMQILRDLRLDLSEMPQLPEIPALPELPYGDNTLIFDSKRYKEEGETYMNEWSKNYEEKFGKEYAEKMELWAKEFEKSGFDQYSSEMEIWGEDLEKVMEEKYGEEYEKRMEEWGEAFGERFAKMFEEKGELMEKRAEEMELRSELYEKRHEEELKRKLEGKKAIVIEKREGENSKVKKTIKIRMPKNSKLKVNVRHGEIKFATVIHNLNAKLSHSNLVANSIDGSETSINASYTPVAITNWNAGELELNYVDNAQLGNVKSLMLSSNSSNIKIDNLTESALIDGSFGDLTIKKIADSFTSLNIILENSDALLKLPESSHKLQFYGKHSSLNHPKKNSKNVTAFSDGNSGSKSIVVNAKYSNVVMN